MVRPATTAWLWNNSQFSDVQLRLCVTRPDDSSSISSSPSGLLADPAGPFKVARRANGGLLASRASTAAAVMAALTAAAQNVPGPCVQVYSLHACILAGASTYFKARTTSGGGGPVHQDGSGGRSSGGGDSGGGGRDGAGGGVAAATRHVAAAQPSAFWQVDVVVAEEELDAMEAVLRHCYTGALSAGVALRCPGGRIAAPQPGIAMVMQMVELAIRFGMPLCEADCCAWLTRRDATHYDIPAINAVLAAAAAAAAAGAAVWRNLAGFPAIVHRATERLLQLLGNVDAVCTACHHQAAAWDGILRQQLLGLTLPSLLVLLSSDALCAHGENSVLTMASEWVAHSPAAAECLPGALRRVAATLRLSQLSYTFLCEVAPDLPWLQLAPAECRALSQFAMAGGGGDLQPAAPAAWVHTQRQAYLIRSGQAGGPAAWYQTARRAARVDGTTSTFEWEVSRADLASWLRRRGELQAAAGQKSLGAGNAGAALYSPHAHFYNGFTVRLALTHEPADDGAQHRPQEGWYVCYQLALPQPGAVAGVLFAVAAARVTCGVVEQGSGGACVSTTDGFHRSGRLMLCHRIGGLPPGGESAAAVVAAWGSYLVQGVVQIRCTVEWCE